MNAAMKKSADDATVKAATKRALNSPAGIARIFVLGLAASNSRSTSRLNDIAAERAPTIATTIHKTRSHAGRPLAARTAPRNANGNAKIKWSSSKNGTARAVGSSVTLPAALNVPSTSLVWGEASYTYEPSIGYMVTGTMNLSDQIFMRPRLSETVTKI